MVIPSLFSRKTIVYAGMDISALNTLKEKISQTWDLLKLDETKQRILDLEGEVNDPNFWNDQERAKTLSQELNELLEEVSTWEQIAKEVDDALELAELAQSENDESVAKDVVTKTKELQKRFDDLEFYIMLSDEYDKHDAILAFHAGAGGADAQDWTEMLLRMITRHGESRGWKVEVIDLARGQEAGIKSATLHIKGRYAYGYLQSENGVHRLVRQSPFNSDALRQTSFAMIEVIPDMGEVAEIEIDENEIRIDVFRSGGNGGQSVNTTDSAVRIVHEPTGITVVCQNEKSQHQNKATAMKILKSRLHQRQLEQQQEQKQELRGEHTSAEWGNHIRSYVLHPYKMVKDHRTLHESSNPDEVLDGKIEPFTETFLRWKQAGRPKLKAGKEDNPVDVAE